MENKTNRIITITAMFLYMMAFVATDANASSLSEVITKMATLIRWAALIIGWGLGFMFCVAGIMDLMKKDDDPRAGSKGMKKVVGGVALASLTLLVDWMAQHFNLNTTQPSFGG